MANHPKIRIIAEVGVNHNGSTEQALALIDAAAKAGASIVKFQLFDARQLVRKYAHKADYQFSTLRPDESQYEMLQRLELDRSQLTQIIARCDAQNIVFMASPFDVDSLQLLAEFGCETIKLASGELSNLPFLYRAAQTGKHLIVSTGMGSIGDIEMALAAICLGYIGDRHTRPTLAAARAAYFSAAGKQVLAEKVTLLHATSLYPTPPASINLRAMQTMHSLFGLPVGLSDHSPGITVPIAAAALGACVIEKHLTLDQSADGPDHSSSLEPAEFSLMVNAIRETEQALGSAHKQPQPGEEVIAQSVGRSIVAARSIAPGELFSESNLTTKRPAGGLPPLRLWELVGLTARRAYAKDEPIT